MELSRTFSSWCLPFFGVLWSVCPDSLGSCGLANASGGRCLGDTTGVVGADVEDVSASMVLGVEDFRGVVAFVLGLDGVLLFLLRGDAMVVTVVVVVDVVDGSFVAVLGSECENLIRSPLLLWALRGLSSRS